MGDSIKVGLMGLGTVGSGVFEVLQGSSDLITHYAGGPLEIARILVRNRGKPRSVHVQPEMLTTVAEDILADDSVRIVVEVIGCPDGSSEPAMTYLKRALSPGKHVVTANKQVLAEHGPELLALALEHGVSLSYEAAVCGAIPIVRTFRECLVASGVVSLVGIMNGTTNYILSRMSGEGMDFAEALGDAQDKGYAEADPSSDVEGHDAAYKLAILASLAFRAKVSVSDIRREGIARVTHQDIAWASEICYQATCGGEAFGWHRRS
jgi:homoserine dehydrogenase